MKRNSWQSKRAIKELRYHYLNAGEMQTDQQFVSLFPFLLILNSATHTHRQTFARTYAHTGMQKLQADMVNWRIVFLISQIAFMAACKDTNGCQHVAVCVCVCV